MPIVYNKFFALLKEKGITMYVLRRDKIVGVAAMEKMRKGEGHIDTRSIERLCEYLDCQPGDLMEYVKADLHDINAADNSCPLFQKH